MRRNLFVALALTAALLLCGGCGSVQKGTNVQKGALIGGGALGAVGAKAGHMSTLGGVPGALIGLGVGATAGALVADYYYPDDIPDLPSVEKMNSMQQDLTERQKKVQELRTELDKEEAQRRALMEAHEQARTELAQLRSDLGSENVSVSRNDSGEVKMTILSDLLFDSGQASLTSDGQQILSRAAERVREEYPNARIEVRGHTDNVPIRYSKWKSNWELSCHRALAVVHLLIEKQGFDPKRIRAVGMADTRPVADNDSAEGRKKNRRAEIVIRPESTLAAREL
jgi:flagellar motor protein MotB